MTTISDIDTSDFLINICNNLTNIEKKHLKYVNVQFSKLDITSKSTNCDTCWSCHLSYYLDALFHYYTTHTQRLNRLEWILQTQGNMFTSPRSFQIVLKDLKNLENYELIDCLNIYNKYIHNNNTLKSLLVSQCNTTPLIKWCHSNSYRISPYIYTHFAHNFECVLFMAHTAKIPLNEDIIYNILKQPDLLLQVFVLLYNTFTLTNQTPEHFDDIILKIAIKYNHTHIINFLYSIFDTELFKNSNSVKLSIKHSFLDTTRFLLESGATYTEDIWKTITKYGNVDHFELLNNHGYNINKCEKPISCIVEISDRTDQITDYLLQHTNWIFNEDEYQFFVESIESIE
ncbi:MAG: hypothetical protein ACW98X_19150 [Promethearchaeota archaeon]